MEGEIGECSELPSSRCVTETSDCSVVTEAPSVPYMHFSKHELEGCCIVQCYQQTSPFVW